jgi:glyoxylase-like metal-dependent hydrolase (beta-lactamase superfamily II)
MSRTKVLAVVIAVGALSMAAAAYQQPAATDKVVEVNKLKDNLFVLVGGGGNTAVFVQASGVTVVDTKNPGWGAPILAKIKELTPKPITTIINTHTHGDHVSGNVEFPATVEVVTHENTKANMEKMASGNVTPGPGGKPGAPSVLQGAGGKGLPKRTFKDRLTLGKGADQIDLYYFGRAHTNGDAFIVFPSLRVMHTGDVFARKGLPFIDTNNGGSGVEYPNTLSKHGGVKNVDTIITGHSTQMTMDDLREYAEFMREFVTAVQTASKAGQTADQIAASWKIGDQFKGYTASEPAQVKAAVDAVLAGAK